MRICTPREQFVAVRVVVVVFNDNARGGRQVVLMVGCLVEFVKGFRNLENGAYYQKLCQYRERSSEGLEYFLGYLCTTINTPPRFMAEP